MNSYRFTTPLSAVRRAKFDNLAVVPASLLPYKKEWQALANQLPHGDVLLILPEANTRPRQTLDRLASQLKAKGCQVTRLPAGRFPARAAPIS